MASVRKNRVKSKYKRSTLGKRCKKFNANCYVCVCHHFYSTFLRFPPINDIEGWMTHLNDKYDYYKEYSWKEVT